LFVLLNWLLHAVCRITDDPKDQEDKDVVQSVTAGCSLKMQCS